MAISPPHPVRAVAIDVLPRAALLTALVLVAAASVEAALLLGAGTREREPASAFGGSDQVEVAQARPLYREPPESGSRYRLRAIRCGAGAAAGATCFTTAP